MITEEAFLQDMLANPADDSARIVMADWLEENGDDRRAELLRVELQLRRERGVRKRTALAKRALELLAAGVKPAVATFTNSLGMVFALVPPGLFLMGTGGRQADHDEGPRRVVRITRPYYLGVHHVTQGQYEALMKRNPSYFGPKGEGSNRVTHLDRTTLPVETVSYNDIRRFLKKLTSLPAERKAGRAYRLPTEAEWEYACRAGVAHTRYFFDDVLSHDVCRFHEEHPMPVGSYPANLFGIHDMHGNAWEWCEDWFDAGYYSYAPAKDPAGPESGTRRVLRGGAWSSSDELCRAAIRGHNTVNARHNYNGFRVALTAGKGD